MLADSPAVTEQEDRTHSPSLAAAQEEIAKLRSQQAALQRRIHELQAENAVLAGESKKQEASRIEGRSEGNESISASLHSRAAMAARYSRHLVLPSFGPRGQENLKRASVLIVGAGGLGAPAALYLAAAGIGKLGIADRDVVEMSNLHRQVIHTEASIGLHKAASAAAACRQLNSWIEVVEHHDGITAANSLSIIRQYSVVVDASDNVPTRYLLNDACVVTGTPLVSGAALGLEGQLTVYNHRGGPCYRCLFPHPPPQAACQRCSDAGVLGVVPGVIGCLQALEAVKIAADIGEPLSGRMLLFDALTTRIHLVKLRGQLSSCVCCGADPQITEQSLPEFDYEAFTHSPLHDQAPPRLQVVPPSQAVSVAEYRRIAASSTPHVLIDVRPPHEFQIGALPEAVNVPFPTLEARVPEILAIVEGKGVRGDEAAPPATSSVGDFPNLKAEGGTRDSKEADELGLGSCIVFVVCRRGNDSQLAVEKLRKSGVGNVMDIAGGLQAWAEEIDPSFPVY